MLEKGRIVIESGNRREVIPIIAATPTRGVTMSIKDMKILVANSTSAKKT